MAAAQPALDDTFHALSDPTRRAVVQALGRGPASVSELAKPFGMALPSFLQHLKVLETADIVIAHKVGRVRWNHLNALPIKAIHDRWIGPHAAGAVDKLAKLKSGLERG